jgi:hypothetical protein
LTFDIYPSVNQSTYFLSASKELAYPRITVMSQFNLDLEKKKSQVLWVKKNRKKKHINSPTLSEPTLSLDVKVALEKSKTLSGVPFG